MQPDLYLNISLAGHHNIIHHMLYWTATSNSYCFACRFAVVQELNTFWADQRTPRPIAEGAPEALSTTEVSTTEADTITTTAAAHLTSKPCTYKNVKGDRETCYLLLVNFFAHAGASFWTILMVALMGLALKAVV